MQKIPVRLTRPDGVELQGFDWIPDPPASRTIVLVHGLGEHSGRYERLALWLADRGFRVRTYDHRGHGRSGGPRATLHHAKDLLHDLGAMIDSATGSGAPPVWLLGHSMGGMIAARYALSGERELAGLVLSSPALEVDLSGPQQLLLSVMSRLAPNFPVPNGLDAEFLSHDAAVGQAYTNDPLVNRKVTAGLVRFIIDAGAESRHLAPQLKVPTLLLVAGDDRLVAAAGSRKFADAAPREYLRLEWFDGLYHEIFNEAEALRAPVFAALDAWIGERTDRA
jgi:alpha-beta hydrolase superfamily lysophospholipase